MAKIVTDIQNVNRSVLAMVYEDGSLTIECSYFTHDEDDTTLSHKLEISPEGAKVLHDMLVRATEQRNEAESGDGAVIPCYVVPHVFVEGICAHCGTPETPHPKNTASAYPAPR